MALNRPIRLKLVILWLALGLHCQTALALSSDSEQPIHIEADWAKLNDRKRIAIYRGNVHLTQGSLHIDSDVLILYYTPDNRLKKAIAKGDPAWYRQRPDNSRTPVRAKALRMEYHADTHTIYLFKNAHVWQGNNEFSSDRIVYDIRHNIVKAGGSEAGTGRVHVIIRPGADNAPSIKIPPAHDTPSPPPAKQAADHREPLHASAYGQTKTWLNLRAGPGTDHNKKALIPPQTQVKILERRKEWLRVTLLIQGKRREGWVNGNYVRLQDPPDN